MRSIVIGSLIFTSGCAHPDRATEFDVSNDGDGLLIPVSVDGQPRLFIVDTGSTMTVFDVALLHGQPEGSDKIETAGEKITVPTYRTPAARIANFALKDRVSRVGGLDLSDMRHATGLNIWGIVGMDFLKSYVLKINFDRGKLMLRETLDEHPAFKEMPLKVDEVGSPYVVAEVNGWGEIRFMIDTGSICHDSGEMDSRTCSYLSQLHLMRSLGIVSTTTAGGSGSSGVYEAEAIKMDGFEVSNPVFSAGGGNWLSNHYLSRFNVIFDFPKRLAYLQPSRAFDKADQHNRTGLHFDAEGGAVVIDSIASNSPAEEANIQVGDRIVSINDIDVRRSRLFELECAILRSAQFVDLVIERAAKSFPVRLRLDKSPTPTDKSPAATASRRFPPTHS